MDKSCGECGLPARRLRKGRCDACYMRLYRGGEVASGQECAGCGERRRVVLALAELGGQDVVLCGNCALVLTRVRPRLESVDALRARVLAERHDGPERRRYTPVIERRTVSRRTVDSWPPTLSPPFDPALD